MANGFNPLQSFAQGLNIQQGMQDMQRQEQLNQLRSAIGQQAGQAGFNPNQSLELQQLAALDPAGAAQSLATFNAIGQDRQKAFFQDARKGRRMLDAGDVGGFTKLVENRLGQINAVGGDPSDSMAVLSMVAQGDIEGAKAALNQVEMQGVELGLLSAPEKEKTRENITANISDFLFHEELLRKGETEKAAAFANKANLSRLSPSERAQLEIETSRLKEQDKTKAKRLAGYVSDGVGAADGVNTIKRSLELLKTVKTGGIDSLKLYAAQKFGIEGADEGELSNKLGKAVLSQLRATFGAAFTAKEGEQLQRIEAGFGKSSATNTRLLESALKTARRAANRGVRAANELGDDFAANEIKLALEGGLEGSFRPQQNQQPTQPQAIKVGRFTVQEQ